MDVAELASHKALVPAGSHVFTAQYGDDRGLFVEFFEDAKYQEFESLKQGKPVYKNVAMIKMFTPGNKTDVVREVKMEDDERSPSDPHRFPKQWERFKAQTEQVADGMPLEQWAFLKKAQIMDLKARSVHTVEQLATLPDAAFHNFSMGIREMRDKALSFLNASTGTAENSRLQAENDRMKADIEAMKQQLLDLAKTQAEGKRK
jgi:hypothetical protein